MYIKCIYKENEYGNPQMGNISVHIATQWQSELQNSAANESTAKFHGPIKAPHNLGAADQHITHSRSVH
jgi:hypothetical protein